MHSSEGSDSQVREVRVWFVALAVSCAVVAPLPDAEAPTETWLGVGLGVRSPTSGVWSEDSGTARLTLLDRRFGEPLLTITRGAGPAGPERARLANGGVVVFTTTSSDVYRVSTATLTGTLSLGGETWTVSCVGYAETEDGADPRWCLPVLASARIVTEKP